MILRDPLFFSAMVFLQPMQSATNNEVSRYGVLALLGLKSPKRGSSFLKLPRLEDFSSGALLQQCAVDGDINQPETPGGHSDAIFR